MQCKFKCTTHLVMEALTARELTCSKLRPLISCSVANPKDCSYRSINVMTITSGEIMSQCSLWDLLLHCCRFLGHRRLPLENCVVLALILAGVGPTNSSRAQCVPPWIEKIPEDPEQSWHSRSTIYYHRWAEEAGRWGSDRSARMAGVIWGNFKLQTAV
jgi:hypothetical protein